MKDKVILLVEDNPRDEALTRRALSKSNIVNEVVVARDGVEALDYLFGTGAHAGRDMALITRHLARAGYDLHSERVETREEMHAALSAQEWDVILCDYSMPHFNAPAALAVLKEMGLDIPFIIISGTVGEAVAVEAM